MRTGTNHGQTVQSRAKKDRSATTAEHGMDTAQLEGGLANRADSAQQSNGASRSAGALSAETFENNKAVAEHPNGTLIERTALRSPNKGILLYVLTYISEGLKVKGFLAVPDVPEPSPGIIYCRGGIRKVGMVRKRRILSMAKRGYAVFAPFYRGNEGGEGREDFGGQDRFDVYHAITLLQSLPEVKRGRIPLIGFSRGAIMAMLAAKDCKQAGPVVVWGGVSDLFDTYEQRVDLRRMLKRVVGHPRKQKEQYESRSPVYWLEQIRVPVLIVHGMADSLVSVSHARKLAEGMEAVGKDFTMELYEGMEHRFPRVEDEKALDAVFSWISQKLERMRET